MRGKPAKLEAILSFVCRTGRDSDHEVIIQLFRFNKYDNETKKKSRTKSEFSQQKVENVKTWQWAFGNIGMLSRTCGLKLRGICESISSWTKTLPRWNEQSINNKRENITHSHISLAKMHMENSRNADWEIMKITEWNMNMLTVKRTLKHCR